MKKHDHHILSCSPWPLFLSIFSFFTAFGVVFLIHNKTIGYIFMPLGASATLTVLYFWWRDVVREAIRDNCFTEVVKTGLRLGLTAMILSETMFFFAFFWSFFKAWLYPAYQLLDFSKKVDLVWPPIGIKTVDPWSIPFLNTVTLLLSGCTITWAHHFLIENKLRDSMRMLFFTVLLGVIFSAFQVLEYAHAGFSFSEQGPKAIYASNFYMVTGFHGLHVVMGIISLVVCLIRMWRGQLSPSCHIGFECAAWYWHFVDVIWLFLFIFMYVVSS